jgi:hypothetical protein
VSGFLDLIEGLSSLASSAHCQLYLSISYGQIYTFERWRLTDRLMTLVNVSLAVRSLRHVYKDNIERLCSSCASASINLPRSPEDLEAFNSTRHTVNDLSRARGISHFLEIHGVQTSSHDLD